MMREDSKPSFDESRARYCKGHCESGNGSGLVIAESIRRLRIRDLGPYAFDTLKRFTFSASRLAGLNIDRGIAGDFTSSEAEFRGLREVRGRRRGSSCRSPSRRSMENLGVSQGKNHEQKQSEESSGRVQSGDPQPEELFAPRKAEESRESRPFTSQADSGEEPLSQKIDLPSVDPHLPPNKSTH